MHLIQILLPLYDNAGRPLAKKLFSTVARELADRFGGLTAHTRAPAEGLWKGAGRGRARRDDLVVYEVTADELERRWWGKYRRELEGRFKQDQILVRAQLIEVL